MANKQNLAQKVTAGIKKDAVKAFEKGLPDGRSTLANMEAWRNGAYEKLVQKGAAHYRVFYPTTP